MAKDWRSRAVPADPVKPSGSWKDRAVREEAPAAPSDSGKVSTSIMGTVADNVSDAATGGFGDEAGALAQHIFSVPGRMKEFLSGEKGMFDIASEARQDYRDARDDNRITHAAGDKENKVAAGIGTGVGTALSAMVPIGVLSKAAQGLKGWQKLRALASGGAKMGAIGAAASAVGTDDQDLTDGVSADEALQLASKAEDSSMVGGVLGGAAGAVPKAASVASLGAAAFGDKLGLDPESRVGLGTAGALGLAAPLATKVSGKIAKGAQESADEAANKVGQRILNREYKESLAPWQKSKREFNARKAEAKAKDAQTTLDYDAKKSEWQLKKEQAEAAQEAAKAKTKEFQQGAKSAHEKDVEGWSAEKEQFQAARRQEALEQKRQEIAEARAALDADEERFIAKSELGQHQAREKGANKEFQTWYAAESKRLRARSKLIQQHEAELARLDKEAQEAAALKTDVEKSAQGARASAFKEAATRMDQYESITGKPLPEKHAPIKQKVAESYERNSDAVIVDPDEVYQRALAEGMEEASAQEALALARLEAAKNKPFDVDAILAQVNKGPISAEEAYAKALELGLNPGEDPKAFKHWERSPLSLSDPAPEVPPPGPSKFDRRRQALLEQEAALDTPAEAPFRPKPEFAPDQTPELPPVEIPRPPASPVLESPRLGSAPPKPMKATPEALLPAERAALDSKVDKVVDEASVLGPALKRGLRSVMPQGITPNALLDSKLQPAQVAKIQRTLAKAASALPNLAEKYGNLFNQSLTRMALYHYLKNDPELLEAAQGVDDVE